MYIKKNHCKYSSLINAQHRDELTPTYLPVFFHPIIIVPSSQSMCFSVNFVINLNSSDWIWKTTINYLPHNIVLTDRATFQWYKRRRNCGYIRIRVIVHDNRHEQAGDSFLIAPYAFNNGQNGLTSEKICCTLHLLKFV